MDDEVRTQIALQCKAVAHLATALAQVSADYAKMFEENVPAMADIADRVGQRSAKHMEILGDILNGMDAVDEEDDWLTPVFEKAHKLWPDAKTSY